MLHISVYIGGRHIASLFTLLNERYIADSSHRRLLQYEMIRVHLCRTHFICVSGCSLSSHISQRNMIYDKRGATVKKPQQLPSFMIYPDHVTAIGDVFTPDIIRPVRTVAV